MNTYQSPIALHENAKLGFNQVALAASHHGGSPTAFFYGSQLLEMLQHQKGSFFNASEEVPVERKVEIPVLSNGYSELHSIACSGNQITIRHYLETADISEINQMDRHGNTALHWAVSENHTEVVKILLENGADANIQNYSGEHPLFLAAARGNSLACISLIQAGARLSLCNMDGATPLHIAASQGHLEVVKILLQFGAHVFAQDFEGDSVLHYAVRESHSNVVRFLVAFFPALLELKNEDDETPADLADSVHDFGMLKSLNV